MTSANDTSNEDIDGMDVCVEIGSDGLSILTAKDGDEIGTAGAVLLDEPTFSDGPYVYGTVTEVDTDARIKWNMMARMFRNDMLNAVHNGDAFAVSETARMTEWDYSEGDPIEDAMTGMVLPGGVGVMLPNREADDA